MCMVGFDVCTREKTDDQHFHVSGGRKFSFLDALLECG